jgi:hypothetical protein
MFLLKGRGHGALNKVTLQQQQQQNKKTGTVEL